MSGTMTPAAVAIPAIILLSYLLLGVLVVVLRGVRGGGAALLLVYLVFATALLVAFPQTGLRAAWPDGPWDWVAAYALLGLGAALWAFGRVLLQQRAALAGGVPALVLGLILAIVHAGLVPLPPFTWQVGAATITTDTLALLLGVAASMVYTGAAVGTAVLAYRHRASPLHRNRIVYWLIAALASIAGLGLALSRQATIELIGAGLHWLGAALFATIVIRPQLPNLATGVRRAASYLLAALIPAAVAMALSLALFSILSLAPSARFKLSTELLSGLVIAGLVTFLAYLPLSRLTRRAADRVFFGDGFEAQAVVREYSQAITQTLSLKALAATALAMIDRTMGIRRGTFLVVDQRREQGWWLRVIEGLDVAGSRPPITLTAETPLAQWLARRGDPLHQYTLDVDPRFSGLDPDERAAWQQLDMEVFVPIRQGGNLIGLLALGVRRSGQPYTEADLALLETLADQTAVALENAALFDRAQRRADQLALLNEIGRVITTSLDLDPAVDLIAERTAKALPEASGFVFLLDDSLGDLILRRSFGQGDARRDPLRVATGQGLVGWVTSSAKPLLLFDPADDPRYAPEVEGMLAPEAESMLCVPILARREAIGAILLASSNRAALGPTELNLLDSIASFASIAIDNARKVATRERQLREQVEALRIEIDDIKRAEHVQAITDTDSFRQLRSQARRLREKRGTEPGSAPEETAEPEERPGGVFGAIQEALDEPDE